MSPLRLTLASMQLARREWIAPWLVALAVFLGHGWFYNGTGGNQNARLDPVYAFVEPGPHHRTLRIDSFITRKDFNTPDWARHDGHHYSNKAPGTTLLAIPFYEMLWRIEIASGKDPASLPLASLNSWIVNLFVSVLPAALLMPLLYAIARRQLGMTPGDAVVVISVLAFASLLFPFDTQMWGHTTAAIVCAAAAWAFLDRRWALAGFLAGVAVLVDHLALTVAVAGGLSIVLAFGERTRRFTLAAEEPRRALMRFVAGGLPAVVFMLVYQKLLFGSFFRSATEAGNEIFVDSGRVAGVFGLPSLEVAWALLFSLARGWFVYTPVFLFAFVGAWWMWRERGDFVHELRSVSGRGGEGARPPVAVYLGLNVVASILLVASFNGWRGGASSGPRYLIPAVVFWALLLPRFSEMTRALRALFVILAIVSAANMFAIASVTTMETNRTNPLYGAIWPKLMRGEIHVNRHRPVRTFAANPNEEPTLRAWNAGTKWLAMSPHVSVVSAAAGVAFLTALALLIAARSEQREE